MTADRSPPTPRIEDLVEHASWLRALAVALVRDAATADDLVQDTWLAAMRNPRPHHVAPRAWLTGIARNLAKMGFRGGARRARREQAAAADEALPGPAELVERLETQRRLAALVAELREPVRSIVLLRFYEGLDSGDIARRLGEPAGTVRWRLKQGLDELRTRLDAEHGGDRGRWTAAFVPLAVPRSGGADGTWRTTTAAGSGGLLMASTSKLIAAGALVLLLLASGAWWSARSVDPEKKTATLPLSSAANEAMDDSAPGPTRESRVPRRRQPSTTAAAPETPAVPASATKSTATRVVGRVADPEGVAIADATVRVGMSGPEHRVSDDGRFSVDVALPDDARSATLLFVAPGRAMRIFSKSLERGAATDLGDVTLAVGGVVSGRIVDGLGRAVAGAAIVLVSVPVENADGPRPRGGPGAAAAPREVFVGPDGIPLSMFEPSPRGPRFVSDDSGAFDLRGLPAGETTVLRVIAEGHRYASQAVTARADAPVEGVRIVLARQGDDEGVEGRVVAPDGTPAANAQLVIDFDGPAVRGNSTAVADADGRFHLETYKQTLYGVRVADAGRRWVSARVGGIAPGSRDVVVKAIVARTLSIEARGKDGAQVKRFSFKVADDGEPKALADSGYRDSGAASPARVFAPVGPFTVVVRANGFATATRANLDPAEVGDRVIVTLDPLPGFVGVVRTASGPFAGARVTLHRAAAVGTTIFREGFPMTREPDVVARASTDASGAYELTVRDAGRYVLRAEATAYPPGEQTVNLEAARGGEFPPIVLAPGGSIEGTVRTGGSRNPEGLFVCASCGDGVVHSAAVGADGRYRLDGLAPGSWMVRVVESVPHDSTIIVLTADAPIEWDCAVQAGRTTTRDVGFGAGASCVVRGKLTTAPGVKWFVGISYTDTNRGSTDDKLVAVGVDGAFEVPTERAGDFLLTFMTQTADVRVYVPVKLAAGERRVDLALDVGAVEVVPFAGAPDASRMLVWDGAGGAFALANVRRGDDGKLRVPVVPAGRARVVHFDAASKDGDPRKWPVDAEVDVRAGQTTRVELR